MSEASNLKSQIAQVDQKVQALRSALTKVQGVDLNVDDVMEGYEKLHVFGTNMTNKDFRKVRLSLTEERILIKHINKLQLMLSMQRL